MSDVEKRHLQLELDPSRRPGAAVRNPRVLIVTSAGYEEIPLQAELTIGRAFSCGLRLDGDDVSRLHATITRQGDTYILRDMKSRNGVEVNGARIERHILASNDVIQVGPHFLLFEPTDSIDLDALLDRASAIMAKARSDAAAPVAREFRPGNDAWEAAALVRQIERSVLAFVSPATPQPAAPEAGDGDAAKGPDGKPPRRADDDELSLRRAIEPFHKAVFLLHETATVFWRQNDWGGLCKEAARVALDVLGGNKALIMLRRPDEEDLQVGALVTRGKVQSSLITPAVMRFFLEERRVLVSGFARDDHRLEEDRAQLEAGGIESILGAPLLLEGDCIGFFYVDSQLGRHRYCAADARLFFVLAEHLGHHLARLL